MSRRRASTRQQEIPLSDPAPPWRAKGIFTEHIIRHKLPESRLWPPAAVVEAARAFCLDLWTRTHVWLGRTGNESHTRQELLDPVLRQLGFEFLPDTALPCGDRKQIPDYLLYPDGQTKQRVFASASPDPFPHAIALLEAKKVNHPLDVASKRDTPGRFPHQQVRGYLDYARDLTGRPFFNWAILANGKLWRLYCRNATPDGYFEFNFEKALESSEDFAVFVALFRPAAFIPDAEGRCALDELREDALRYQTKLEDDLRERVFNILEDLANGFFQRTENRISENQLPELYENCLILLYRLLFALYAEGRGLLPVRPYVTGANKDYRERYSLQRLLPKLRIPSGSFCDDTFTDLYEELLGLFRLINGDSPTLNRRCDVPQYNGGLFSPKLYPKLQKWRVGEKTLAEVLRGLMFGRVPARRGQPSRIEFGETIDYAELEVRQLGSIYEGLLENHLELKDGRLVLVGDRAERKATGTYYTPDYIVRYIVEHTLGPLCERIEESAAVKKARGRENNAFADAVLQLRVLDPAMGSGHFLVRATEYLADRILNHPTTAIPDMRVSQGLSQALAVRALWRRRVVEHCIFGVDLNPLAVELAKLSLWLTCIATDQPLSFLDHHLRAGNSLIGAQLADLAARPSKTPPSQPEMWTAPDLREAVSRALRALAQIEAEESKDIQALKQKEARWTSEVLRRLGPYRAVADLWASAHFGLDFDRSHYPVLAEALVTGNLPRTNAGRQVRVILRRVQEGVAKLRRQHSFFHWELEFPEVFFEPDGSPKAHPGFDAVIGNPPWGQKGISLDASALAFVRNAFASAVGIFDLFRPFVQLGILRARAGGFWGSVLPDTVLLKDYPATRRFMLDNLRIAEIDFWGMAFESAVIDTVTVVGYREPDRSERDASRIRMTVRERHSVCHNELPQSLYADDPQCKFNLHLTAQRAELLAKLARGPKFSDWFELHEGVHSGNVREKLFVSSRVNRFCMPLVLGRDEVRRYRLSWAGRYVDLSPGLVDRENGEYANTGRPEWYEGQKLVIRRTGDRLVCGLDSDGLYFSNNVFIARARPSVSVDLRFVLGLLNSRFMNWFYLTIQPRRRRVFAEIKINHIAKFPLPLLDLTCGRDEARYDRMVKLVQRMLRLYARFSEVAFPGERDRIARDISDSDRQIDELTYTLYGLSEGDVGLVEQDTSDMAAQIVGVRHSEPRPPRRRSG